MSNQWNSRYTSFQAENSGVLSGQGIGKVQSTSNTIHCSQSPAYKQSSFIASRLSQEMPKQKNSSEFYSSTYISMWQHTTSKFQITNMTAQLEHRKLDRKVSPLSSINKSNNTKDSSTSNRYFSKSSENDFNNTIETYQFSQIFFYWTISDNFSYHFVATKSNIKRPER